MRAEGERSEGYSYRARVFEYGNDGRIWSEAEYRHVCKRPTSLSRRLSKAKEIDKGGGRGDVWGNRRADMELSGISARV